MMAGIYRCILLLIVGLFFSSLSYAKNTEIPSYEEGISLFACSWRVDGYISGSAGRNLRR